ncbi:MAG: phytanoyl-CoA dioxygenase family protein [Actinomycetota bacterium]
MFRDPARQEAFARDGFAVVPLVDDHGLRRLRELWDDLAPDTVSGIYSNVHDTSPENNRRVDALFRELFEPRVAELFVDCYVAGNTFLVKGVGEGSESKLHQDWNNVDEQEAISVALWCPLVDVDEHNGALQVLPGSHRLFAKARGITTPSVYLEFDERLEPLLHPVPVPAGTAVFYAHNLFHGSKPNHSDEIRVCAVSGVLPKGADHLHLWQSPDSRAGTANRLVITDEFFYSGLLELYGGQVPASARSRRTRR